MAIQKMTTLFVFVVACALIGLSHGADKECNMEVQDVLPKIVTCITKKHPEYFMLVLTKMEKPADMENPDFLCSQQGLMTALVDCTLQYMEGCMPPELARQVAELMPSDPVITKAIAFLCDHREDFNDPCVKSRLMQVGDCISSKMQTYTKAHTTDAATMRSTLCYALDMEEKCIETTFAGCREEVTTDIKTALRTFFPKEKCYHTDQPQVLRFEPENQRH